ncbi:AHH domain-containing protein [Altererythrobacter sp. MF3-039]|uniref:AHH domain-containing protein n=1 Tax=Altererythrobacter sp. MF3-039 TaxID=3252901 RepID=UPI00390CC960
MRSQFGGPAPVRRRGALPFRSVNRPGTRAHDPSLQRHHLLPRQLVGLTAFDAMFSAIGHERIGFEDFRRNGLLLPARDHAAVRMGLPLHRGPHRDYNEAVIERVSIIDREWRKIKRREQDHAGSFAQQKMAQLQDSLRESLLSPAPGYLKLNSKDPLGKNLDYRELDDVAERLWAAS